MVDNKSSFDYILSRIDNMFKVIDISNEIVTAKNLEDAKQIHETEDFDRVPIKDDSNNIKEYYDSNSEDTVEINPTNLISESCGILETLNYLSKDKEKFYFVLMGNQITHIVHYSDLNDPIVLNEIYAYIVYCEVAIRKYAEYENNYGNTENGTITFLNDINNNIKGIKINIGRAVRQFDSKKGTGIETNLFDELYIDDELILFRELISKFNDNESIKLKGSIDLNDDKINLYKDLRNYVMHSKDLIISKEGYSIETWIELLQTCQDIISYVEGYLNGRN